MEFVGYGSTIEEARADAWAQLQEERDFRNLLSGYFAVWFWGIVGTLYTTLQIILRPLAGTFLIVAYWGVFYWLGIVGNSDGQPPTGIGIIFRFLGALLIIAIGARWARRLLLKVEEIETKLLFHLQDRNATQAYWANSLIYGYSLLFLPVMMPLVFSHWLLGVGGLGVSAPGMRMDLLFAAVLACGVRYFSHPFAKTMTLAGAPRESSWRSRKQDALMALTVLIPMAALYLGTSDWAGHRPAPVQPAQQADKAPG
jgi:hypothetical protein